MRRVLALAPVGAWVGLWLAREVASYAGRYWLPRGGPPTDSPRQPGRMPLSKALRSQARPDAREFPARATRDVLRDDLSD